ncbi:Imm52 family immunity protein [Saccharothrix variisporea]|uniref:Immunity protein 52 domain-containing protein n=1 Tax=Saccharothrix variisporea TaxID=543527 RepID=A0A495X6J4_9PSEU|nr:Imm52 family immunity protein [Saccharothrix variisporea]RKT69166.1 hypothetical protein DFJ66_2361 [Saccharothrix variisporea]
MTTNEPVYLAAYWGDRADSLDSCADRLRRTCQNLAQVHDALGRWYRKGRSKAAAEPVPHDSAALRDLLVRGRNRADADGRVIEELGYSVGLWNRGNDLPVSLNVTCGHHAGVPGVLNSVVLGLPELAGSGPASALYRSDVAVGMISAVVEPWDPDWALLAPYSLRDAQARSGATWSPVVGWLTYLSPARAAEFEAPEGASVSRLGDGRLVVIGEDLGSLSLTVAMEVRRRLVADQRG